MRARRDCLGFGGECTLDWVRRTVWDQEQELWEIQMPDNTTYQKNDTAQVKLGLVGDDSLDPNPYYGRLVYTHGLATDQPLSVTRVKYGDGGYGKTWTPFAPFSIIPLWNTRAQPDNGYLAQSTVALCPAGPTKVACVQLGWFANWQLLGRFPSRSPTSPHVPVQSLLHAFSQFASRRVQKILVQPDTCEITGRGLFQVQSPNLPDAGPTYSDVTGPRAPGALAGGAAGGDTDLGRTLRPRTGSSVRLGGALDRRSAGTATTLLAGKRARAEAPGSAQWRSRTALACNG